MKTSNFDTNGEIKFVSESKKNDMRKYIEIYNGKCEKRNAIFSSIARFFRYTVYTPISIAFSVASFIFKIGGSIAAIGIPYGVYCAYLTVKEIYAGVALEDLKHTTFVCLFLIFPFAAFALSFFFNKVSEYLTYHK